MIDKTAIIIPTYNEKVSIQRLLAEILELYPGIRIVVVDDNSPDGTAKIVQRFAAENERVKLIWREEKQGLASAYLDAFARLIPDDSLHYYITMDADYSHHPKDIAEVLNHLQAHDLVVGSRYISQGEVKNWASWRLFISKFGNIYTKAIVAVPIFDLTAGFVGYRRELLFRILPFARPREPYAYQTEMKYLAHRHQAKIKEVPIVFRERESGKTKFKTKAVWQALFFPWYLRFFR